MEREDLDRNFGFLLHDVARLMRTLFDRRGRDLGLTRSQWWVLTMLYAKEGVTPVSYTHLTLPTNREV